MIAAIFLNLWHLIIQLIHVSRRLGCLSMLSPLLVENLLMHFSGTVRSVCDAIVCCFAES